MTCASGLSVRKHFLESRTFLASGTVHAPECRAGLVKTFRAPTKSASLHLHLYACCCGEHTRYFAWRGLAECPIQRWFAIMRLGTPRVGDGMDSSTATWRNQVIPVVAAIMVGLAFAAVIYGGWRLGRHLLAANPTSATVIEERASEPVGDNNQGGAAAAVAPAILYDIDPTGQRKRYDGSVSWRTEITAAAPKIAIKADAEIPEKHISVALLLRRNVDPSFPASHVLELKFSPISDMSYGEISSVPGLAMKRDDEASGVRLTVQGATISPGFFLLALSDVQADIDVNLKLLKEQPWLMIPIVYSNGNRATLNFSKGASGERVFNQAFVAWGE